MQRAPPIAVRQGGGIRVAPLRGRGDRARFIALPHTIYRGDPCWVPMLHAETRKLLDRRRNPYFAHGEAEFWLAWRGDTPVGRISAQINRLHLELHRDSTGNFGMLEAIDDAEVFAALLGTAEAWLAERGMARALGPMSLSMNDEIGVLVSGFGMPPMIGMAYSPRYYAPRLEAAGYAKAKDLYALSWDVASHDPREFDRLDCVIARTKANHDLSIRPIEMHRFEEEMRVAIEIYNDAWSDNWGFVPVTAREVKSLIAAIRPFILPKYVLFGEIRGRPEAIFISLPNINEVLADLGGKLFPLGWAKLLWGIRRHRFRSGRVIFAGVRRAYRDSLASAALISWLLAETMALGRSDGTTMAELSWVLEDNQRSLALCQRAGGEIYKTYRLFAKPIGLERPGS